MTHDEPVVVSESASRISQLFDLRLLIGGLLSLYGVILIVVGLLDSGSDVAQAAGVGVHFWTGIGVLVGGLLFLLWMRLRPWEPLAPGTELDAELATCPPPEDVD